MANRISSGSSFGRDAGRKDEEPGALTSEPCKVTELSERISSCFGADFGLIGVMNCSREGLGLA